MEEAPKPWLSLFFLLLLSSLLNTFSASKFPSPSYQFLFPDTISTVVPDPSIFFSPKLLSSPLPTNSFFQNFVIGNGDEPEYIHPYLIKSSNSSLSVSYPFRVSNSSLSQQLFIPDLTISALNRSNPVSNRTHFISSFSDLSVTLDIPSGNFRFFLVRGSPYLTFTVKNSIFLSISTAGHGVLSLASDDYFTKHIIQLSNNQTWVLYSSGPIHLTNDGGYRIITSDEFSGVIRVAILPDSKAKSEEILDKYSSCYPVSGDAKLNKKSGLKYKWEKRCYDNGNGNVNGNGSLLLLSHPLHRRLLSGDQTILEDVRYDSIDGDLLGVVGNSWSLEFDSVPITWHSLKGIQKKYFSEIAAALHNDVKSLNTTELSSTASSYFYGKLIARAARLVMVAEEIDYPSVIPAVENFLRNGIEPWLDGKFDKNGFLYERKWAGMVTERGGSSTSEDFGFGIYNDHHFHLGYYVYSIAVLAKNDPDWGLQYKPQAYALVSDFMNYRPESFSFFARLRNFDPWKLHSWAAGLTPFPNGRNQESTSEAVNAYYSAALLGLVYGDETLASVGSTLATLEILSAQTWWHVKSDNKIYDKEFVEENRVVGILWSSMRESRLWFVPAEFRECRVGIQVLPLLPITERLFTDEEYVRELVEWSLPALKREDAGEGWKGFVYALQGIYDKKNAIAAKIYKLKTHDNGNSLTNLLWWIYSRPTPK